MIYLKRDVCPPELSKPRNFRLRTGQSVESLEIDILSDKLDSHFHNPVTRQTPVARFHGLLSEWLEDTEFLSDSDLIALHPAYQQIIGMGKDALPFIFADFQDNPGRWFWALRAITGCNPVPEEARGQVQRMAEYWLQWAEYGSS